MKESILRSKSIDLARSVVIFCRKHSNSHNYTILNQLIRCGTSVGACIAEAGAAQTRKDFITKMAIASKEARETLYWLKLIEATDSDNQDCAILIKDCEEVVKLLTATVKTAQLNEKNTNH